MDSYFFEIPVYRCSKEEHEEMMDLKRNEYVYYMRENKEEYERLTDYFNSRIYYNWKYNEIIGWIGLCFNIHFLEFHCYLVDKKRINKVIHKKEFVQKKWDEISINFETENSQMVVDNCCKKFNEMTEGNSVYKGRFIDDSSFKACGIFLDWKHLAQTFNRIPDYKI